MAANTIDTFYVLLTNVSPQAQAVFRTSNSWGYYAMSFELRTNDGRVVAITKKPTGFTKNNASTFVIPPGEQMVYPIKLDDSPSHQRISVLRISLCFPFGADKLLGADDSRTGLESQ
jgi:hypothetical protein